MEEIGNLSMETSLVLLLGLPLLLGFCYGYVSVKGQFCMNSGFSNVIRHKDSTKLKSFIAAILIQMLVLPLLFTLIYLYTAENTMLNQLNLPPLFLIGTAVGGFLFGIFMYYTAGCGAGIFYKIGEKNAGAIFAALGFVVGIVLSEKWFLSFIKNSSQRTVVFDQKPIWQSSSPILFAGMASIFAAAALLLLYRTADNKPRGAQWGWRKTGMFIGIIGIIGWGSALLAYTPFGMAIIPGVIDMVDLRFSWPLWFVIGIPLGAFWSTRKLKQKRFSLPKSGIIAKRLFGGLGLGVSGSVAAGCTVGHGLTFFPLLGVGSIVATLFIFLGSGLVGYLTRK